MNTSRGLCVGINKFASLPTSNWLNGCVNDAEDMAAVLRDCLGFAPADVSVLCDEDATKAAVMSALTDLVDGAVSGDVSHLVFSFSSHGTQVPDRDDEEPDLADEALAAYDIASAGDDWDSDTVIVDDELRVLFDRVPAGILVEVFLDTCHSGTGLRAMDLLPGRRPKFLPAPTPAGVDALAERDVVGVADRLVRRGQGAARPVLFAACRADQTAADAHFDGRFNGAFTYYLVKALRTPDPGARSDVLRSVRADLRAARFGQSPQLEARAAARKVPVGEPG